MIIIIMNVLCNYSMNLGEYFFLHSFTDFPNTVCNCMFTIWKCVPGYIFLLFTALICCGKHFTFSLIAFCLVSLHGPSPLAGQGYQWSWSGGNNRACGRCPRSRGWKQLQVSWGNSKTDRVWQHQLFSTRMQLMDREWNSICKGFIVNVVWSIKWRLKWNWMFFLCFAK